MFNKTDFNLPLDQHIEKINQLIEKTEDLIQFYHDFCVYNRLPKELKKGQNWLSKYRENKQKFKEFKIEWNNFHERFFYGLDNAPTCGILDEEIVSELEHRLGKLKFYAGILKAKKELISERENASSQVCNLQPSSSLDADPVKSCLKESENYEATQPANQTCLEESGNTDATDLEPDSQTCLQEGETICLKATDQDTSQPAVTGTMKVDWETTPTETGSLDNDVTDLKPAGTCLKESETACPKDASQPAIPTGTRKVKVSGETTTQAFLDSQQTSQTQMSDDSKDSHKTFTKSEIKPSWVDSNEEIINQYQNRKSKNWNKQNYTKSYNNDKANQYKSYKNNIIPNKIQKTRTTNRIDEYNKNLCKMYHDMKKHNCKGKCDREDLDVFYAGHRSWMTCWYPQK